MNSLAFVQCHSSCVLGAPLDEVWDLVRSWGALQVAGGAGQQDREHNGRGELTCIGCT